MERIAVWFRNARYWHHRLMARYLRRRGWVVFYLAPEHRYCGMGNCWLELYQQSHKSDEEWNGGAR